MVVKEEERHVAVQPCFGLAQFLAEGVGRKFSEAELRVHGQMQLVVVCAVHLFQLGHVGKIRFPDQHAAGKFVSHLAQLTEHVVAFREIVSVLAGENRFSKGVLSGPRDRLITKLRVFE